MIIKTPLSKLRKARLHNYQVALYINLFHLFSHFCIAGGALRTFVDKRDEVKDLDIFIIAPDQEQADFRFKALVSSLADDPRFKLVFECPIGKLATLKDKLTGLKLQVINDELNTDVADVLNKFDFNACRLAVYCGDLYWTKNSLRDIKSKVLSLHCLTYPVATLKRAYKYMLKGYNINELLKELLQKVKDPTYVLDEDKLNRVYID